MIRLKHIIATGAIAGVTFAAGVSAQQQQQGQQTGQRPEQRQQAQRPSGQQQQSSEQSHKLSQLKEASVQDQQGEDLGQIDDLVVDIESGKIAFVLISGGGVLGIGADLHPVPPEALQISGSGEELQVQLDIDQQQWENAPTVSEDEIAQLNEQGQEIYRHYDQEWQEDQEGSGSLQLAGDLSEKTLVDQQKEEIGKISDALVNLEEKQLSFVLIQPKNEDNEYAVSARALEMESEDELRLNVTRQDFEQVETLSQQEVPTKARKLQEMEISQVRQSPELFRYEESGQEPVFGERPDRRQQQQQQGEGAEIQVQQPGPDVRIRQPQPEIQVEQQEPEVEVEQAEPNVEVEQGQPNVEYETGEPNVEIEREESESERRQREQDRERRER